MKRIDLHIHTNFSDGKLTPKEVIDEAKNNGVSIMSITDHDTIDAYNDEVFEYAKSKNIKLIPGIEISTKAEKTKIHMLAYNFDINNKELINKLESLKNARHTYLHNVSKKLKDLGYTINTEKLDEIETVTKAHIALDIIENKENEKLLLKTFNYIPNKGEFIETIMNKGCPAYVKKETITPKEAVTLIKQAKGIAIMAHPVAYKFESKATDEDVYDIINDANPDGIEANYIYTNRFNEKINEVDNWNNYAYVHNLITTLGSDFHSKEGHNKIGLIDENLNLTKNDIDEIINNITKK